MTTPRVYFIEDVCRELRCARRTVERLRRYGAFPIPELPALDKRPRWSADAVNAYLASEGQSRLHGRQSRPRLLRRQGDSASR